MIEELLASKDVMADENISSRAPFSEVRQLPSKQDGAYKENLQLMSDQNFSQFINLKSIDYIYN